MAARAAVLEDDIVNHWRTKRPFSWGHVVLLDRDSANVPQPSGEVVSPSRDGLAVKVLHAQDVDLAGYEGDEIVPPAEVQVDIFIGDAAPGEVLFTGFIDLPSGVLTVGDAEREDALKIGAGRWAVQVDCQPSEFAELVRVWLRPA